MELHCSKKPFELARKQLEMLALGRKIRDRLRKALHRAVLTSGIHGTPRSSPRGYKIRSTGS
jgi:hypothetical protein